MVFVGKESGLSELKAVVIGAGKIGAGFGCVSRRVGVDSHAGAWEKTPGVRLVGLSDPDPLTRSEAGRRWSVPVFGNSIQMLSDQAPELASIAVPDELHAEMMEQCLSCPTIRGILIEKPLALDKEDASRLTEIAKNKGISVSVNYSRRFSPILRGLAQQARMGQWGGCRRLGGCYTKGLFHNGTHWLDWARALAGEVSRVHAYPVSWATPFGNDATLDLRLEFFSGAIGCLQALSSNDYAEFEMDAFFERSRLRFSSSGHRVEVYQAEASLDYPGYINLQRTEKIEDALHDVLLYATIDLVNCVRSSLVPACSGADGLAVLHLAEMAILSAQKGCPVDV